MLDVGMTTTNVLVLGGTGLAQEIALACGRRARVLGPVASMADVVEVLSSLPVDLLVADVDMSTGIHALRRLQAKAPGLRTLAVTDAASGDLVGDALGSGAVGVLVRGGSRGETAAAVRLAAAGELVLSDTILRTAVASLDDRREGTRTSLLATLTDRERQILASLGQGTSVAEIAVTLDVSSATVRAHVKAILRKLGVHSTVEAVRILLRAGVADGAPPVAVGA
jgi:DNA-binding NarL/FixJ family response regulator